MKQFTKRSHEHQSIQEDGHLAFIMKLVQSEMMRKFTVSPHVITAVKTELKIPCGKLEIHQES
jgi:hypothetical protein